MSTQERQITVKTNHFELDFDQNVQVIAYDVTVTPDDLRPTMLNRVWGMLCEKHDQLRATLFDKKKMVFSRTPLTQTKFTCNLDENSKRTDRPQRKFDFNFTKVNTFNYAELSAYFNGNLQNYTNVQAILQVINIAISRAPNPECMNIQNVLFPVNGGPPPAQLCDNLDVRCGLFTSARAGTKLTLNVDASFTAFRSVVPLMKLLNSMNIRNFNSRLDERTIRRIDSAFRKLKVHATYHREGHKKTYEIKKVLSLTPREAVFALKDETETNVEKYLREKYNLKLNYPNLPCAETVRGEQIPIELLIVAEDQKVKGRLTENQTAEMIRHSAKRPDERSNIIMRLFKGLNMMRSNVLDKFGIRIRDEFLSVDARVLPFPQVKYAGNLVPQHVQGVWNLKGMKLYKGSRISNVGVLNLSDLVSQGEAAGFVKELLRGACTNGMEAQNALNFYLESGRIDNIERHMHDIVRAMKSRNPGTPIDLLIVIISHKSIAPYAEIKRVGDTVLGVVTQVITFSTIKKSSHMIIANISLKLNMKNSQLNVVNCFTPLPPVLFNEPTMVVGIDISHANPGSTAPSVATMVGSYDVFAGRYYAVTQVLNKRQEVLEGHAGEMMEKLIRNFAKANSGRLPVNIVIYRDGVSEGEFDAVKRFELMEIQQACERNGIAKPRIALIIVRKRHHTRFFPMGNERDKSGNCLAGLHVSSRIVAPGKNEFYLLSQAGLQGTSRPALYTILQILNCPFERELHATIPALSFALCTTYQRCTRSVSIPAPVYYAHSVCTRARLYMRQGGFSDTESVMSGASDDRPYTPVHPAISNLMYFM